MKRLLLIPIMLFTLNSFSQSFATLDGAIYKTDYSKLGWGMDFTGGAFIKNKEDKNKASFMIGAGVGAYMFTENDLYAPIFFTMGYFNGNKKITPYINCRIGYGFYKGSAKFIGKNEAVKGGLYTNARAGAGFKVTSKFYATPFVGVSLIMLRKMNVGQSPTEYNNALFNAGICLFFKGK